MRPSQPENNLISPVVPGRPRAVVAVETALVMPLILLMVFSVVEYGRYLATREVIEHAVREAARFSVVRIVDTTTQESQVQDEVHRMMAGFESNLVGFNPNSNIRVYKAHPVTGANTGSWKDAGFGEYIAVEVVGEFRTLFSAFHLPGLGGIEILGNVPINVKVLMYSEAN